MSDDHKTLSWETQHGDLSPILRFTLDRLLSAKDIVKGEPPPESVVATRLFDAGSLLDPIVEYTGGLPGRKRRRKPRRGPSMDGYLTLQEFCSRMGINRRTADRRHAARRGPPRTKIGKQVLYRKEGVLEWLRNRETPSGPPKSAQKTKKT